MDHWLLFGNASIQLFEKFRKIGFTFSLQKLNPSRPTLGRLLISNIQIKLARTEHEENLFDLLGLMIVETECGFRNEVNNTL